METQLNIVSLLMVILATVAFFILLPQIKRLLSAIIERIEKGSGLKFPGGEIAELKYDSPICR